MVPLIPFLMLGALPAIDRLLSGPLIGKLALLGLTLFSFAIQIAGTVVNLYDYERYLGERTGLPLFSPSVVWSVRWSQAIGSLLHLGQAYTDIRWFSYGTDWWMVGTLVAIIACLGMALVWQLQRKSLPARVIVSIVPLLMTATAGMALLRAYDDPRYLADRPDLAELRQYLTEHVSSNDVILLAAPGYVAHFANYYKGTVAWYSLPLAPGERYSPDQEPTVVSDDVQEQLGDPGRTILKLFMRGGEFSHQDYPIWLIEDLTPGAHPWSTRPAEHFLLQWTYRVNAVDFSDRVRLVEFLPYSIDPRRAETDISLGWRFGDDIRLVGFDTVTWKRRPLGATLVAGNPVGFSLLWEALDTPELDYTVAMFVIGPDGLPVLQQDTMPLGGFRPTNTWVPGEMLRDNYGFWLPEGLAAGEYQIWLVIYDWRTGERLPVTGPDGEALGDHAVLWTLEITPPNNP